MKLRWATIGLVAGGVILAAAFVMLRPGGAQREVDATRQLLRQQGFKTDLDQFNFSTSPEMRNRVFPLTGNGLLRRGRGMDQLDLMAPVGSNTALVLWPLERLPSLDGEDGWAALRKFLDESRAPLDAASDAVLSGPIQFDLNAAAGSGMLLRHLSGLRSFSQNFGFRAVLQLHDRNKNDAWTNVLAATRLVSAWATEPAEVSQLVRCNCADLAVTATWQLLQTGDWDWQAVQAHYWDDDRLAALQREWEAVDFFKGLPETAAFSRASMAAICQQARKQPATTGLTFKQLLRSPRFAWSNLSAAWQQFRYRQRGSYDDEKALLLYYRDRELLLRQAVQSPSWIEMRRLPGVTNAAPFQSKSPSRMQALINMRQLSLAAQTRSPRDGGLLGRAAEAEARRRIVITAIALERFRGQHGSYPKTMAELSPPFLKNPPVDFMDGQPLRYRLADDGHFLLYSVGLDCVDDGGQLPQPISAQMRYPNLPKWPIGLRRYNGSFMGAPGNMEGSDLVWALPASAVVVKARQDEEERQEKQRKAAEAEEAAVEERESEARRVAMVQKLMATLQSRSNAPATSGSPAKEPAYRGKPLGELLRNEKVLGTNRPAMGELLTLKQIITGDEPCKATFELPLSYDAVTNFGELVLLVDGQRDDENSDSGFAAGPEQSCGRATNGNCLLIWDTTYDPPGQHVVCAEFTLNYNDARPPENWRSHPLQAAGPLLPYYSTNLCQFSPRFDHYEPTGATLYAKLVEPAGIYSIEIQSTNGEHIRTITGRTTNGIIHEHWDLTDDHGKKFTNDSFETIYDITLPGSGRSQRVK